MAMLKYVKLIYILPNTVLPPIHHQRGIYWWGNALLLVGNLEGLVGIFAITLLKLKNALTFCIQMSCFSDYSFSGNPVVREAYQSVDWSDLGSRNQ